MKRVAHILMMGCLGGVALGHPDHGDPVGGEILSVPVKTGSGAHVYENIPWWGMDKEKNLGFTNGGVAIDAAGLIYFSTDSPRGILVYNADGSLAREVGPGHIHNLIIRKEGEKEFIWAAHGKSKRLVKLTLAGEEVFALPNDKSGEVPGGFGGITAVDILPDGTIFVAMGYGSNLIHKFDGEGKLLKSFGGKGKGDGQTNTCHGLALDHRFSPPRVMVADRENSRLVAFDLDGNWLGVVSADVRRPTDIEFRGDACAVTELAGGVKFLDKEGKVLSLLGENPNKEQVATPKPKPIDVDPKHFTAPHGLAFDKDGNLYVQDYNRHGRITKLKKIPSESDSL